RPKSAELRRLDGQKSFSPLTDPQQFQTRRSSRYAGFVFSPSCFSIGLKFRRLRYANPHTKNSFSLRFLRRSERSFSKSENASATTDFAFIGLFLTQRIQPIQLSFTVLISSSIAPTGQSLIHIPQAKQLPLVVGLNLALVSTTL